MEPDILAPVRDDIAMGVVVGASPLALSAYKWLSSTEKTRDEVRAYASRLAAAWNDFWNADVKSFATQTVEESKTYEKMSEEGVLLGDVISTPGSDPKLLSEKQKKVNLLNKISSDRYQFKKYLGELDKTIGAPSPTEAWSELRRHEKTLHSDRAALEDYVDLKSEDPGNIEIDKPKSRVWPLVVGGGVLAAVAYLIYKLPALARRAEDRLREREMATRRAP